MAEGETDTVNDDVTVSGVTVTLEDFVRVFEVV